MTALDKSTLPVAYAALLKDEDNPGFWDVWADNLGLAGKPMPWRLNVAGRMFYRREVRADHVVYFRRSKGRDWYITLWTE